MVLHTRARAEKSVARAALRHGIAFFLPLHKRRWRDKGRTFTSCVPLPLVFRNFNAAISTFQFTPATPTLLLPIAPMVPET